MKIGLVYEFGGSLKARYIIFPKIAIKPGVSAGHRSFAGDNDFSKWKGLALNGSCEFQYLLTPKYILYEETGFLFQPFGGNKDTDVTFGPTLYLIFILKRYNIYIMVTLKEAKEVSNKLAKTIQPVSVIVFGSVSQKGKGNDLDLLIIADDRLYSTHNLDKIVYKTLHEFSSRFAIDPFIISLSKLREYFFRGSPFLRAIQKEGRVLYMKDSIKEWIKQANEELAIAEYLLQGSFYRGVCYHSQQTIEKSVKAFLLQKGWELEKIHSFERLLNIAEQYNIPLKIDEDDIIFIDSIYRGRYPAEEGLIPLGEPSQQDAQRSVKLAEKILRELNFNDIKKTGL